MATEVMRICYRFNQTMRERSSSAVVWNVAQPDGFLKNVKILYVRKSNHNGLQACGGILRIAWAGHC